MQWSKNSFRVHRFDILLTLLLNRVIEPGEGREEVCFTNEEGPDKFKKCRTCPTCLALTPYK
jgi:hypothetical protein